MSEIEQLRREINELRERVAQLEWNQRKNGPFGAPVPPQWVPNINPWPPAAPYITCKATEPPEKLNNYDPHYAYY